MIEGIKSTIIILAAVIEVAAAIIITAGILEALIRTTESFLRRPQPSGNRGIRLQLGRWLTLSLEFLLAADILRTAAAPSWNEIGQLAAIATIRTALNYFLEKEINRVEFSNSPAYDLKE